MFASIRPSGAVYAGQPGPGAVVAEQFGGAGLALAEHEGFQPVEAGVGEDFGGHGLGLVRALTNRASSG
jgi:hypothetical protein